jgi:hypothetical protein
MKTKLITAIIAFVVAFGFSTAVTRLFVAPVGNFYSFRDANYAQNRQKIFTLLQRDVSHGQTRLDKLEETNIYSSRFTREAVINEADIIGEYTNLSENLDYSDLPREFQTAWRDHIKAWRDHADFYNLVKNSCTGRKLTDGEIAEKSAKQSRRINETWYKVLRIAKRYDAIPEGAL